ncbi:MAG TPA: HDOD domain-containing protein [Verrucomicrobiales bacterium]|nr:HDOD domain-containing protein [Verrucomicrobiales bacterium]
MSAPGIFRKLHAEQYSIDVAGWAKSLTWAETGDQKLSEEAFTAGLLHDVGKRVLASNLPEDYEKAVELAQVEHRQMWEAESEVFKATHAETGAYLLGLWGMPVTLVEAVPLHHFPNQCFSNEFNSLTAVHVADALIHDQQSASDGGADSLLDMDYLKKLGLDDRVDHWKAVLQQEKHDTAFILPPQIQKPTEIPVSKVVDVESPFRKITKEQKRRMVLIPAVASLGFVFMFLIFVGIYSLLEERERSRLGDLRNLTEQEDELIYSSIEKGTEDAPDSGESIELVSESVEELSAGLSAKKLPELKLEGILYNKNLSIAIINGRVLRVGDTINEASVLEIKPDRIKLVVGNDEKILLLDQSD